MNLLHLIPFWDSLDSVRRVHSRLEFASIVFFALLAFFDVLSHRSKDKKKERICGAIGLWFFATAVLCELLAYPYGQRNDTLSEEIIGSLAQKAEQAKGAASDAVTKSGEAATRAGDATKSADGAETRAKSVEKKAAALDFRLDAASHKVDELNSRLIWRHIDPKKRGGYIARLKPFAGSLVLFDFAGERDPEAIEFANQVLKLLHDAGWVTRDRQNTFGTATGLICTTSESSLAGQALAEVVGTLPSATIRHTGSALPAGIIVFGLKPPP